MAVTTSLGFEDHERDLVASMYWEAFGPKLNRVMGPDARGIAFIRAVLDPTHAICARSDRGDVVGIAGFKTYESALVHYGHIGAAWRSLLMSLLEVDTENNRFLVDGIFVRAAHRGMGVGSILLSATAQEARNRGYEEMRLDVTDTNPRARALYERHGFMAHPDQNLGFLKHVFGFKFATPMTRSTSGI